MTFDPDRASHAEIWQAQYLTAISNSKVLSGNYQSEFDEQKEVY